MRPVQREGAGFYSATRTLLGRSKDLLFHIIVKPASSHDYDRANQDNDKCSGQANRKIADDFCSPAHGNAPSRYSIRLRLRDWSSHSMKLLLMRSPSNRRRIFGSSASKLLFFGFS